MRLSVVGNISATSFTGDGSNLTGVRLRFEDKGDGTVLDRNTGLYWLKNANCAGLKIWQSAKNWAATLANGTCGLMDGSTPGQWRVPTIAELCSRGEVQGVCPASNAANSLVNSDFNNPSLSNRYGVGPCTMPGGCPFSGVQSGGYYWSSTALAINPYGDAWLVYLGNGSVVYDGNYFEYYVWPVRGGT
jgi:hypothetical protein